MTQHLKKRLVRSKWSVCHPGILCEQLEDRIVLDAAAGAGDHSKPQESQIAATVSVALADPSTPVQTAGQAADPARVPNTLSQVFSQDLNVVLISSALDQVLGIADSAAQGSKILFFDPTSDSLATINQLLDNVVASTGQKISTLAVFSHGSEGLISLGSEDIGASDLNVYASDWAHLSGDLASDAQIQFYACSVAGNADGRILLNTIASFTGASVFASVDSTGGTTGNWALEYSSNSNVSMNHVMDSDKLADLGVDLAQVYPTVDNNWGKAMSGAMYFASNDGEHGTELWRSDGTAAGTYMVADINTGSASADPAEMTVLNGMLYFRATDGNNNHGTELWCSDGTEAGTYIVKDINPNNGNSDPTWLTVVNGVLYFSASDGTNASSHGTELWCSDGTEAGTTLVKDINPGKQSSTPTFLTAADGTLFFTASDGTHGNELWKSDGTTTELVKDVNVGKTGSGPAFLTWVKETGTLYFSADDGTNGTELWESHGTDATTELVKDINVGKQSSDPSYLTDVNGTLFFAATNGSSNDGNELWSSDGTATGTVMVHDINTGNQSSNPSGLLNLDGVLYFAANDGIHGNELWKSDGTDGGTQLVLDIDPGHVGSDPKYLNNYDGVLLFTADDGSHGYQLWRSDGTDTVLLKQINLHGSSFPLNFARLNPLFFLADDGSGFKLWKTDGTAQGTVKVSDEPTQGQGGPQNGQGSVLPNPQNSYQGSESSIATSGQGRFGGQDSTVGLFSTQGIPAGSAPAGTASHESTSSFLRDNSQASAGLGNHAAHEARDRHADGFDTDGKTRASQDGDSGPIHDSQPGRLVKVVVMDDGNYSVQGDNLTLVVSHQLWIPPMVKWYLAAVSEGRYRPGSLPREYERMIIDFLQYASSRQQDDQPKMQELEARLAWQWADWRRQVVKERGNPETLPWKYFRGLSEAMTLFYGQSHGGKVDYSDAVSALHQNVRNLTIIPIRLPDDSGALSTSGSVRR